MDGEGGRWPSIFHIPFSIQLFSYRGGAGNRKPARNLCIEIRERRQRVYRQLVRVSREPPTDPDNHLNDNCRQRGINCRPRNKLHVPVTASILVTRPPIAALAALPLSHPPPTRNSQLRFHHYVLPLSTTTTTTTTTTAFHEYYYTRNPPRRTIDRFLPRLSHCYRFVHLLARKLGEGYVKYLGIETKASWGGTL